MGNEIEVTKVGMLGVGSMGAMMSLLMAEHGYEVHFHDPVQKNMDQLSSQAKSISLSSKILPTKDYEDMCKSIQVQGQPKVFMFSTPHGKPADQCVDGLLPFLNKGDIIVDCGNEHWHNTERRQRALDPKGIHYVGCGVSGGYQSARHGPSMSPGGSPEALEKVMPFLRTLAAKDQKGSPCTTPVGPAGSGHFVKMVHNGIEQGMMSVVAEAWLILTRGLGLGYREVAEEFKKWNEEGPLRNCFLISIAVDIEKARGKDGSHVLGHVRDKVVQDVDEEEGTGIWTSEEAVHLHVPAATILSAHLFRCASADLGRRMKNKKSAEGGVEAKSFDGIESRDEFAEWLHRTTYFCFLTCFAQGLDLIRQKDKNEGWNLNYVKILQLWRGGCIIQADGIADLLEGMYKREGHDPDNLLSNDEVGSELHKHFPAIKQVVLKSVEADHFVPAIGQSLEYFKYETSSKLPTQFTEAQLDYFGQHMYDDSDDPVGGPKKGKHHFEWKQAEGLTGK
ncbi:6-phosphogluconate dehydrogenase [Pseudomassariella vexata]|uniref:6-phosphogluconate dehydrogenase, decarboxylating n=1 Tax=Pseudomassariella vexata TaxID=1141098 RepID=A0A1Y2EK42_9PEZI|nr:6-phosphogluconate dehydrogenase [Pseudomassariella vexata]ORY71920.1 6-phosphogluconate dehydrogenase [Pseudomassariella vexata]